MGAEAADREGPAGQRADQQEAEARKRTDTAAGAVEARKSAGQANREELRPFFEPESRVSDPFRVVPSPQ